MVSVGTVAVEVSQEFPRACPASGLVPGSLELTIWKAVAISGLLVGMPRLIAIISDVGLLVGQVVPLGSP